MYYDIGDSAFVDDNYFRFAIRNPRFKKKNILIITIIYIDK